MGSSVTWRAVAGSTAGTAHVRRGIPGQDYCLLELFGDDGDILVAIGADGAGSASHGQRGAELACTRMLARITWYLDWHDNALGRLNGDIIRKWVEWTREDLELEASYLDVPARSLACTLLGVVASRFRTICFQIGDGAIVLRTVSEPLHVVFWPQSGEYANMTRFLTDVTALHSLDVYVADEEVFDVALFTDGLQRLALQFSTKSVHLPFFAPMFDQLAHEPAGRSAALEQQLLSFLDSMAVNERTDDDKTLILATRRVE